MKKILLFVLAIAFSTTTSHGQTGLGSAKTMNVPTIHEFTVKDISGADFSLASLKGKKVIIVNTASKCGLTPQYAELQKLYDTYKDKGLVIIGFPANNFAEQEPGTNEEIVKFCQANYGVTFPMMEKISVKGDDTHPLYQFLTDSKYNGRLDAPVEWNFQKFLINERGEVVKSISPKESVISDMVKSWIERKG